MSDYNNDDNDNENDNKLKISIALFPDVIKSASQKSHIKFKYNIEWRKSKKKIKILSDSLKRKVLIHFLKLFKEATFLTLAGSFVVFIRLVYRLKENPVYLDKKTLKK